MKTIQEIVNSALGNDLALTPGEYEGPLVVNRACVIDGSMSTLWAEKGPVLIVTASNVTVRNLRVEVTGDPDDKSAFVAIKTGDPRIKLENVEVRGNVIGLSKEEEKWDIPGIITLGEFAADAVNTFLISLQCPAEAIIESRINFLSISSRYLSAGRNDLVVTTDKMRDNTILYGEIMVHSAVTRRIYITGKAKKDAPVHDATLPVLNGPGVSPPLQMDLPDEIIAPQVSDKAIRYISKGQRLPVSEWQSRTIRIIYEQEKADPGAEVDGYCFLLCENGKVSRDEDLVFFGNTESVDHSVRYGAVDGKPLILVDLKKIDQRVSRIVACYSVYGDEISQNFSKITLPVIRVFSGDREVLRFELKDLSDEKTVVAAEIYRYKGEWKINFIGSGYKSGLAQLCRSYGVDVR